MTVTPAASPANPLEMLEKFLRSMFFASTTFAVPVKDCFVDVLYDVTITSSNVLSDVKDT